MNERSMRFFCKNAVPVVTLLVAFHVAHGQASAHEASSAFIQSVVAQSSIDQKSVGKVSLSGNVTFYSGTSEESGIAELAASDDGNSEVRFSLQSGTKVERQIARNGYHACQWTDADGKVTENSLSACWKPLLWFFPVLSIKNSLANHATQYEDRGLEGVGFEQHSYRHLRTSFIAPVNANREEVFVAQHSQVDLGLSPESLLPSVMTYSILPDRGWGQPIQVEVHFGGYQKFDGVVAPTRIQRYVNGTLQADIQINSVHVVNK